MKKTLPVKGTVIMELTEFLILAKQNTYAAGRGEAPPCRPGSHDLAFAEDGFRYLDSYFGGKRFSGQEIVYRDGQPVWSMNYYGCALTDRVPDGFSDTLHQALLRVEATAPFRGPQHYTTGAFRYECAHRGDMRQFEGEERIFFENKEVYRLHFHGGDVE